MIRNVALGLMICLHLGVVAHAGPYSGPSDTTNVIDPAIPSASPLIAGWANSIDAGRTSFAARGSTMISATGFNSLGDLSADEIAAGAIPGFLTVTFLHDVFNGPGADFAVFENGFEFGSPNGLFAEFAYVEVSSNGSDFLRFPSISTNVAPVTGSGAFAGFDVSNIYNLAGKHASGFGTPFDLQELASDPLVAGGTVDLNAIAYVKLVDIPGNGGFLDSQGHPILDNWLTSGGGGGYDFRLPAGLGVGVIHAVPEPGCAALAAIALASSILRGRRRR